MGEHQNDVGESREEPGQVSWWESPPPWFRGAPRWLIYAAVFGIVWGIVALASLRLGRRVLNIQPFFADTSLGATATAALAVLSVTQGVLVLARRASGLPAFCAWTAALAMSAWFWYRGEQRWLLVTVSLVLSVSLCVYALRNSWWFRSSALPASTPVPPSPQPKQCSVRPGSPDLVGIDRAWFMQGNAPFRSLFPERYRDLPPLFYSFIAAGLMFGILGLGASLTVLPLVAADHPGLLSRLSLVLVPLLAVTGILQAVALLTQSRWALGTVYGWFGVLLLAAWVYLPAAAKAGTTAASAVPPLAVTMFLCVCAYYFWNRRDWFLREGVEEPKDEAL